MSTSVLLLGIYALWQVTRKQTNRNKISSACLNISFANESGDICLDEMWPTTDSDGALLEPYTFDIINNCDTPITYTIALESIEDEELEATEMKLIMILDQPRRF